MKFFLGRKSTSFHTQRIVAKDIDLCPSAPKVLTSKFLTFLSNLLSIKNDHLTAAEVGWAFCNTVGGAFCNTVGANEMLTK